MPQKRVNLEIYLFREGKHELNIGSRECQILLHEESSDKSKINCH
jgi:hypothetical protein